MERRTLLTALAAAPLAALASTAHALGRRRRQCYDQPSDSGGVPKGEVPKGVDTPHLTLTPIPGMPGMTFYTCLITVNVTAEFIAGVNEENIMSAEARLLNSAGQEVAGGYGPMTVDPALSVPPAVHYKLSKSPVMLTPTQTYRAQVRVTFIKKQYGLSGPQTA
jgi:hypothetical protein